MLLSYPTILNVFTLSRNSLYSLPLGAITAEFIYYIPTRVFVMLVQILHANTSLVRIHHVLRVTISHRLYSSYSPLYLCTVRTRHFVVAYIHCNHMIIKNNQSTSRSELYPFLTYTQCVTYVHLRHERPGNTIVNSHILPIINHGDHSVQVTPRRYRGLNLIMMVMTTMACTLRICWLS